MIMMNEGQKKQRCLSMAISRMRRYAKVIAFLAICTVGISGCGEKKAQQNYHFWDMVH